ncbi:hypothetical protein FIU97_03245 [Roseivivax sp. THAF40]|uniref:hypothetical protein n=1 Tax=unclassified Roseivivax TaxID=2639302 RepID=UPI0012685DC9|nr:MULTISPECIES: hypothetical protein [unclassified Roseivivax]QFS81783.1 hypothetical protein FIV09_02985 [Roseivivax sp. THAF197b]QFT45583.1 hypothetical protein FIU97_03245 [Roseivivax sp. THAF40]
MIGSTKSIGCALVVGLTLAGCGGGSYSSSSANVTRFATGPIYSACMASDRKARNRALCGCVQASADATLSGGDQRRASRFFRDPQEAHDVKYSQTPRDDAFWDRYENLVDRSERYCRGL